MVLIWMVYASVVAVTLGVAALAAERALRLADLPARGVWTLAAAASLALPALAWVAAAPGPGDDPPPAAVGAVRVVSGPQGAGVPLPGSRLLGRWAAAAAPLDRPLLGGWAAATAGLLLLLGGASARMSRARRGWPWDEVGAVPVRISPDVGPAVIGLIRPEVVLPAWTLDLDAGSRGWIVRHEEEHVRARDPLLVAGTLVPALLAPWNLPLWWQLRRLRQAVEIDCDRRVLRNAGRPERLRYGRLLLDVGRRSLATLPVPAAFAETPHFLERRIHAMSESVGKKTLRRAAVPAVLAAALLGVSCLAPAPDRTSPTGPEVPMEASEVPVDVSRPAEEPRADLSREPVFTPYTVAPNLQNVPDVLEALDGEYPPLLRDAGIGGRVLVYFFIDEQGDVVDVRINRSSGQAELDAAALRVASVMEFTPALNRDDPVPVWISLPITFQVRPAEPAEPADAVEPADPAAPEPPRTDRAPSAVAPPGVDEPPVPEPPRARTSEDDLAARPTFTPYTRPPVLTNERQVLEAFEREYPPLLRDAGIEGAPVVYLFVDRDGRVLDVRLDESSGHPELDAAALEVARIMEFDAALNRDEPVPVWISLPIAFRHR